MALSKLFDFFWFDYFIIFFVIFISTAIGVYFGWLKKKTQPIGDYLQAGKQMTSLPIGLSVAVSHVAGSVFLLVPAEVYKYGATMLWIVPAFFAIAFVGVKVVIPVFYNSKITTIFEYLEKRFDAKTKMLALVFYFFQQSVILACIVYNFGIIFGAAIGLDSFWLSAACTTVCAFYTAIGGLKTVIWSDIFQFSVMLLTYGLILTVGFKSAGGIAFTLTSAWSGQRLDIFDFDLDPTKRNSFWIIVFGFGVQNFYHKIVDQAAVQKFLAVSNHQDCIKAVWYSAIFVSIVYIFSIAIGLIIYAKYQTCDVLKVQNLKLDQLVAYFVMNLGKNVPGMLGLFIAGVLSAGLSSMSSIFNALSGVIYKDFICKILKRSINDKDGSRILKLIIAAEGVICIGISYMFKHVQEMFSFKVQIIALLNGPMLGLILVGILAPKANAQGVFYGSICSFVTTTVLSFFGMYYQKAASFAAPSKPLSIDKCHKNVSLKNHFQSTIGTPFIFKISFYYTSLGGTIMTMILSLLISYVFTTSTVVDKKLLFQNKKTVKNHEYIELDAVSTVEDSKRDY